MYQVGIGTSTKLIRIADKEAMTASSGECIDEYISYRPRVYCDG